MTVSEYNQCVENFADNLFRFILKNLRDEEQSRDIVQETFTKLWIKVEDVSFLKAKSYLFTTGYHTMIDWIRREKRNADFEKVPESSMGVSKDQSPDLQEILQEALSRLPEIQRSVIMLRDYEGYSYQEIGEITNLNESQVKVYIYRARVTLKEYLVSIDLVL
ncbi:MAG: sigma-70 family RNA polymerase sigma factor [Cryomorphaceae bacterium]|jgi:RNA polymerase sigma-70 factor (ECF subfamily)|nr:sigma-70 family RNA polymerase sigma factor [Cryomorphaceae bacterium]